MTLKGAVYGLVVLGLATVLLFHPRPAPGTPGGSAGCQVPQQVTASMRKELLAAREAVWRAWYANDRVKLEAVIPEETVAINPAEEKWHDRAQILAGAREFAEQSGKLLRLEYPRTEIQLYGDVAILYTTYLVEVESQGRRETVTGRGTEIFVRRNAIWVNSGWHLDSGR